jgi:hypothetical protein
VRKLDAELPTPGRSGGRPCVLWDDIWDVMTSFNDTLCLFNIYTLNVKYFPLNKRSEESQLTFLVTHVQTIAGE